LPCMDLNLAKPTSPNLLHSYEFSVNSEVALLNNCHSSR
jgi:hypothetical protein